MLVSSTVHFEFVGDQNCMNWWSQKYKIKKKLKKPTIFKETLCDLLPLTLYKIQLMLCIVQVFRQG